MKKSAYYKKIDNIRKKAINASANVISAPAQIKSKYISARADSETKTIKNARKYKGMPDFIDGKPSEGYKARFMAQVVKDKIKKRNEKADKKKKVKKAAKRVPKFKGRKPRLRKLKKVGGIAKK